MDPIQKTIKEYDEIAEEYCKKTEQEGDREFHEKMLDKSLRYFDTNSKPRVIDLGCGDGRDSRYMKEKGVDVVGIDLSQGMVNLARKKDPKIAFLQMDIRDTVFPDNTFHGAWASASLNNLPKSELSKVEKEVYRILEPGGIFAFSFKEGEGEGFEESVVEGHERYCSYYLLEEIKKKLNLFELIDIRRCPGEVFGSDFIYCWGRARR